MRISRILGMALGVCLAMLVAPAIWAQAPHFGQPATAAEIAALDTSILPDGTGLPAGSGTAKDGALVYQTQCQACHGAGGVGGAADRLVGGKGTIGTPNPVKTIGSYWPYATTLFDFVRRAMPYPAPKSLTDMQVYQVTAYLLFLNGIVKEDEVINAQSLPKVQMPNRNGFVSMWPEK
jgi:S-disulfanyl-L-cysteine oxidoreductase SoxD